MFSSPGQIIRDVNSLTEGIRALTDMSEKLHVATERFVRIMIFTYSHVIT